MTLPDLTFVIGPHTRLSLAVNASVRGAARAMADAGVAAVPSRVASPLVRALATRDTPVEERRAAFRNQVAEDKPAVLCALNFLGASSTAVESRELFPGMAALCLGLSEALPVPPRLVLCIEPFDVYFASTRSDALARRVAGTPWEVLYELSWAELARDILAAIPGVEIAVGTPATALCRAEFLDGFLFGAAAGIADPVSWRLAHLSSEGAAALEHMGKNALSEGDLLDLGHRLGNEPEDADFEARFGLDRLTRTLLAQRFDEDLAEISDLPGVRML